MAKWLFDEPCTCNQKILEDPPPKPTLIQCNFCVTYEETLLQNERIAITGCCEGLGRWKLDGIVILSNAIDSRYHYAKVNIPRDMDISYRYLIVSCNPKKYGVIVRFWESHRTSRKVYNKLKNPDVFGVVEGQGKQISRGWLTTEQYVQFRIFNGRVHYKKHTPKCLLYVKVEALCAMEPFEREPEPEPLARKNFTLSKSCSESEFAIVETASLSIDNRLETQPRCGMRCGPTDLVLYNITVLDPKFTIYRFDVYSMECGADKTNEANEKEKEKGKCKSFNKEPCYIGYGRIEPDDIKGTSGNFKLGIVCAQTHKTIMYICIGYLIINPLKHYENIMRSTFLRNWAIEHAMLHIGHRGSGKTFLCRDNLVRENTIYSFNRAVDAGADMIEFDVMLSADGLPIVHHDHVLHLLRKADIDIKKLMQDHDVLVFPEKLFSITSLMFLAGRKTHKQLHFPVDIFKKQELRSMKALRFTSMGAGQVSAVKLLHDQLPFNTLEEILENINPDVGFNIEIKWVQRCKDGQYEEDGFKPRFERNFYVDTILNLVMRKAGKRRIIFSSFDCDICLMLRYKQNKYPVLQLTENPTNPQQYDDSRVNNFLNAAYTAQAMELTGLAVHANTFLQNPSLVAFLRHRKLVSMAYGEPLVNTAVRRFMKMLGLQGIIFDRIDKPDQIGKILKPQVFILESFLNKRRIAKIQYDEFKARCGYSKKRNICDADELAQDDC